MRWLRSAGGGGGGPADPFGCLKLVARRCACVLRGGAAPERASTTHACGYWGPGRRPHVLGGCMRARPAGRRLKLV